MKPLRPFSLEEAKGGAPICTNNSLPVHFVGMSRDRACYEWLEREGRIAPEDTVIALRCARAALACVVPCAEPECGQVQAEDVETALHAVARVLQQFEEDMDEIVFFRIERELDQANIRAMQLERELAAALARAETAERDNIRFRALMIAAAEEIQEHWDAHCDNDGYGPSNLLRRLEDGIPVEYAYTAGDFVRLRNNLRSLEGEYDNLMRQAQKLAEEFLEHPSAKLIMQRGHYEPAKP